MRITDNGIGMTEEDARLAILRHEMCIRDRDREGETVETTVIPKMEQDSPKIGIYPSSVSYTHLDVYKRQLLTAGEITKDEMLNHPQRNLLTRAVGVDDTLEVDSGVESILPGDRILLCTDGLCGYVSDDVIALSLIHIWGSQW